MAVKVEGVGIFVVTPVNPPTEPPIEPADPTVLAPEDITFLGYYLFAKTTYDLWYSYGQLAFRRVGDELRFITNGNLNDNYPVGEHVLPGGVEPDPDILTATEMPFVKQWGTFQASNSPVVSPHMPTGGSQPSLLGGCLWDEERNGLWYTYGDSYVPIMDHTTLFFFHLNDTTGVGTYYGPWRIDGPVNHVRGALCHIPESFRTHVGGHDAGIMASQASGNATSPFGCNLHAFTLPDPFTHPPDTNVLGDPASVIKQTILMHDLDHRQSRSSNYKNCFWLGGVYQCITSGSGTTPGVPLWGGPDPESNADDTIASAQWIETSTKKGLLYLGTLAEAPDDYVPPGSDPDDQIHQWYGASEHNTSPNGELKCCCHDQDDPYWNATGPGTHYRSAKGWIYNPEHLEATAAGTTDVWEPNPVHEFSLAYTWPVADARVRPGIWGSSQFDPITNRIYVSTFGQDTFAGKNRWAVAVFQVAS